MWSTQFFHVGRVKERRHNFCLFGADQRKGREWNRTWLIFSIYLIRSKDMPESLNVASMFIKNLLLLSVYASLGKSTSLKNCRSVKAVLYCFCLDIQVHGVCGCELRYLMYRKWDVRRWGYITLDKCSCNVDVINILNMFYTKASWPNNAEHAVLYIMWVHDVTHMHKSNGQYVHAIWCYTSVVAELWRNRNISFSWTSKESQHTHSDSFDQLKL